jgi:hypothetical protein
MNLNTLRIRIILMIIIIVMLWWCNDNTRICYYISLTFLNVPQRCSTFLNVPQRSSTLLNFPPRCRSFLNVPDLCFIFTLLSLPLAPTPRFPYSHPPS